MNQGITEYELLISCPGDVKQEVDIIHEIVQQFNSQFSATLKIRIQERHWKKDAYPASGDKPQNVLNKQFVRDCDAAIAIFWTRFGTPTDEYGSGTEEEIEQMIADNKQVFMYFSDVPLSPSETDSEQYKKIQQFREKYKDKGLYRTYSNLDEFKELFRAHLTRHFMSLSAAKEFENSKNPDLELELLDAHMDEPIKKSYKYESPCGLITWKELSEDDLFDRIEPYVTIDDINKYNESLPPEEEVKEYNRQQKLYENAQKNCYDFKLSLFNAGNTKANDIYIDMYFPKDILVYYKDDIDGIQKPKEKPKMPENPVWKAMEEIDRKSIQGIMGNLYDLYATDRLLKQTEAFNNWGINSTSPTIAYPDLKISSFINPKSYDYYIEDHKKLSLHIDGLLHTRQYDSDKFSLIFASYGEFEIKYSVMCAEWKKPVEGKFQIKAEC